MKLKSVELKFELSVLKHVLFKTVHRRKLDVIRKSKLALRDHVTQGKVYLNLKIPELIYAEEYDPNFNQYYQAQIIHEVNILIAMSFFNIISSSGGLLGTFAEEQCVCHK